MSYVIRIIGLASGTASKFDGSYVVAYNPACWPDGEEYDGGLLVTTEDLNAAKKYETAQAAMDCYRQSYGLRRDGEPNRPLTAWTVEIFQFPVEVVSGQPKAMER